MDLKQKKLLYHLDYSARENLSALNKKIGLSKQNIQYKINSLVDKGIIEKFLSVINIHQLGFFTFRTYLRLGKISSKETEDIIEKLEQNSNILWLVSLTGTWDLEVVFIARNQIEFAKIFGDLKEELGERLVKYNISSSIQNLHYKKEYLLEKRRNKTKSESHYGNEPKETTLDKIDIMILIELSEDCRRSNQEIGRKVGVSYHTIKDRIRQLEKKGIIQSYRTKINIQKLGYKHMKAALYLYPHSKKEEQDIVETLTRFSNVTYIIRVLGEWELEVEAEVREEEEFYKILKEVRNKFPNKINDYNILQVTKEIKLNYFPVGKLLLHQKNA